MELFAKRIVNDLKPFQSLWLFSECKFSLLQGERYFGYSRQEYSKNLSSKSLKNTCEGVDFFFNVRLGIYSFTKNKVIRRCFLRIFGCTLRWQLYRQPFSNFVAPKLLWNGLPPLPFLDLIPPPFIMLYPPIRPLILKFFSSPPLFSILKTPYPPHF